MATRWRCSTSCWRVPQSTTRNYWASRLTAPGAMALSNERHYHFPLLSDFEPKGAIAKAYGGLRCQRKVAERALFVIDGQA